MHTILIIFSLCISIQPLVLSKARLFKFIEPQNLPEELGGTLQFNYDLWLQQRKVSAPISVCLSRSNGI